MERDYDTYAQARGLPSLADMLDHDNPKSYLRPGESVADLAKTVKRWSYKGAAITIAKPLWDIVAATPPSAAAAAPVPPKPKGPTLREQLEQDIPAAIFKTVDPDVYSLYMNDLEAAPTDIQDFTRKYFKNLAIVENDTTGTSHYSAGAKAVRLDKSTLKDVRESWVTNKFTHGRHTVPHEIGHALDYSVSIEKGKGAYNYISGISDDFRTALDDMKAEYKTQHSTAVNTGWVRMVKDPKKWAAKDKAQKDAITWLDTFKKEAKKFTAFGWENGSYVNNMRYAGVSDIIDSLTDASFSMGCGHGKEYWKRPGAMQKEAFANLYQLHLHKQQDAIDWLNARYPKLIASFRAIIEGKV
jgi:hypothetical protein